MQYCQIYFAGKWAKSLLAFSIQLNWKKFTRKAKVEGDEIRAVHGVRGCSALALLMSHKAMALFYNPYINRTEMIEVGNRKQHY